MHENILSSSNPFSPSGSALVFIPENSFETKTFQSPELKILITNPIHCRTEGRGHCAIHSIFGVKTKGKYFCNEFLEKRWELRDRIIDLCDEKKTDNQKKAKKCAV